MKLAQKRIDGSLILWKDLLLILVQRITCLVPRPFCLTFRAYCFQVFARN